MSIPRCFIAARIVGPQSTRNVASPVSNRYAAYKWPALENASPEPRTVTSSLISEPVVGGVMLAL